jgi:hypothetical protein
MNDLSESIRLDAITFANMADDLAGLREVAEKCYALREASPGTDAEILASLADEPNAVTVFNRFVRESESLCKVVRKEALRLARLHHAAKQRRGRQG